MGGSGPFLLFPYYFFFSLSLDLCIDLSVDLSIFFLYYSFVGYIGFFISFCLFHDFSLSSLFFSPRPNPFISDSGFRYCIVLFAL